MNTDAQDNLMVRYLLGDLPESEQSALEEQCFTDSDAFDRMWEHENRLVDEYVRGRLATADRARFEAHYLASPVHQRRVATARNLLAAADQTLHTVRAPEPGPTLFQRLSAWSRLSPALHLGQFAMAAGMLLLVAGGAWLLTEQARLRGELARQQAENAVRQTRERELARQVADGQSERDRISAELDQLRKQTQARPAPDSTPQSARTIFAFTLSPLGSVRGDAGHTLTVGSDADQVQLRLTAPPGEWKSLQASIQSPGGKLFWSQQQLKPRAGKVVVTIPADRLPFNDYILTLSGINRAGETEKINRYSFRVNRE
jgi:hypothetical protein